MGGKAARYLANNALGMLALFVALGGVSYAATGGFASGGQLKACVNEEGAIRLLKSGKHCRRGQKQIAWNQTGPAGPKGAAGASGATGATGQMGLTGASGQPPNVMWAQIESDGVITNGHGVTRVEDKGKSPYLVTFEKPVSKCALVASTNDASIGNFIADVRPLSEEPTNVKVYIEEEPDPPTEPDFASVASEFSIIAVC
jgi:hypothetical protein